VLIREELKRHNIGAQLGDLDMHDVAQAEERGELGERSSPPLPTPSRTFRVATVDNYQGEESKIIVTSLVRSNAGRGTIGFLSQIERVNVLLSRAREGMYVAPPPFVNSDVVVSTYCCSAYEASPSADASDTCISFRVPRACVCSCVFGCSCSGHANLVDHKHTQPQVRGWQL
jgi:hypothetical protein